MTSSTQSVAKTECKYVAFLSYSHRDKSVSKKLMADLERYRVPKALVGRQGREGPIPARLIPVFRDEDELPTSANLSTAIVDALARSRYLVVLCSPNSAKSKYVHEEVMTYKRLGRRDRILAIMVAGEPNAKDIEQECFVRSLRYAVDSDGLITDEKEEPIAADARSPNQWRTAVLKIIAGLIGIDYDELYRRHRRRRIRQVIASCFLVLSTLSVLGVLGYYGLTQSAKARASAELVAALRRVKVGDDDTLARNIGAIGPEEAAALRVKLASLQKWETYTKGRFDAGVVSKAEVLQSRYRRLITEAQLAGAESKIPDLVDLLTQADETVREFLEFASWEVELGRRALSEVLQAENDATTIRLALIKARESATSLDSAEDVNRAAAGAEEASKAALREAVDRALQNFEEVRAKREQRRGAEPEIAIRQYEWEIAKAELAIADSRHAEAKQSLIAAKDASDRYLEAIRGGLVYAVDVQQEEQAHDRRNERMHALSKKLVPVISK